MPIIVLVDFPIQLCTQVLPKLGGPVELRWTSNLEPRTSRSHQWRHALINNVSSYYEYTLSNVQILFGGINRPPTVSNSRVLALGADPFSLC